MGLFSVYITQLMVHVHWTISHNLMEIVLLFQSLSSPCAKIAIFMLFFICKLQRFVLIKMENGACGLDIINCLLLLSWVLLPITENPVSK